MTDNRSVETQLQLRVVIFQEGSAWVAQVLERDMAAYGGSPYAALAAIQQVLFAHVAFDTTFERPPLSRLHRAPQVYWRAFEQAAPLPMPLHISAPNAMIEAAISKEPISTRTC
jgi:hypothetical protein